MSAYGARCPACKSRRTATKDARPYGDAVTRRRRQCRDCGHKFTTYEVGAEEYHLIENALAAVKSVAAPA